MNSRDQSAIYEERCPEAVLKMSPEGTAENELSKVELHKLVVATSISSGERAQ